MPGEPVPARLAATILLVRERPSLEVLMVRRHHQIEFASGALVFPGGKIEPQDSDPAWAAHALGGEALEPEQRALRIAALREAFEESGLLLARGPDGAPWPGHPRTAEARIEVASGGRPFLDVVRELGASLELGAIEAFARWITPEFMPKRFDTWFYLAGAPEDQLATCDGCETVDAEWVAPEEALRLGEAGERTLMFPTKMNLKLLAESGGIEAALAAARAREIRPVMPTMERRGAGAVVVLGPDAVYGAVEEPLSRST